MLRAFGSSADGQRGNLTVEEGEGVAELDRAAGEGAADLGGRDGLVACLGEVSYGRSRLEFCDGSIHPFLDGRAAVLVLLVTDERVGGEELVEVIGVAGVVCLEEGGDGGR